MLAKEKPRPREEKAGALKGRKGDWGSEGNSVRKQLNTLREKGDVTWITFLRFRNWPVSKRVNSSKADADDATLIEPIELKAA